MILSKETIEVAGAIERHIGENHGSAFAEVRIQQLLDRAIALEQAKTADLIRASTDMENYCINNMQDIRNIPDEVWVPFQDAISKFKTK